MKKNCLSEEKEMPIYPKLNMKQQINIYPSYCRKKMHICLTRKKELADRIDNLTTLLPKSSSILLETKDNTRMNLNPKAYLRFSRKKIQPNHSTFHQLLKATEIVAYLQVNESHHITRSLPQRQKQITRTVVYYCEFGLLVAPAVRTGADRT